MEKKRETSSPNPQSSPADSSPPSPPKKVGSWQEMKALNGGTLKGIMPVAFTMHGVRVEFKKGMTAPELLAAWKEAKAKKDAGL